MSVTCFVIAIVKLLMITIPIQGRDGKSMTQHLGGKRLYIENIVEKT